LIYELKVAARNSATGLCLIFAKSKGNHVSFG